MEESEPKSTLEVLQFELSQKVAQLLEPVKPLHDGTKQTELGVSLLVLDRWEDVFSWSLVIPFSAGWYQDPAPLIISSKEAQEEEVWKKSGWFRKKRVTVKHGPSQSVEVSLKFSEEDYSLIYTLDILENPPLLTVRDEATDITIWPKKVQTIWQTREASEEDLLAFRDLLEQAKPNSS